MDASQTEEPVKTMKQPSRFLTRMLVFTVCVILVFIVLRGPLIAAFQANMILNGVIGLMLVLGTAFAYRRVFDLRPEIKWIEAFQNHDTEGVKNPPRLVASAAAMLTGKESDALMRLSALSTRSLLDGIASRLEESREISRYFTGLLIFLGLLGTFWGLLGTIGAIGNTINSLSVDGSDVALMFDELKAGLEAPLSGMGTAFSSSLFGLAGSLILGFMDLQASQAQTRFYNNVEDWLSSVTNLSRGDEASAAGMSAASPSAYMTALMEQTADGIERLGRTLKRSDEDSRSLNDAMQGIAESISHLGDKLEAAESRRHEGEDTLRVLAGSIEKLAAAQTSTASHASGDEASRRHLANLDVGIKRLIEEQSRNSDRLAEEFGSEIKLLARTLAATLDARPAGQAGQAQSAPQASGAAADKASNTDKAGKADNFSVTREKDGL